MLPERLCSVQQHPCDSELSCTWGPPSPARLQPAGAGPVREGLLQGAGPWGELPDWVLLAAFPCVQEVREHRLRCCWVLSGAGQAPLPGCSSQSPAGAVHGPLPPAGSFSAP